MKFLRIIGILVFIAGIASILASNYITEQVNEGKLKIAKGEKAVNQANQIFSFNSTTQQVGQAVTSSSKKKIAEGKEQITDYQAMAHQLMVGGVIGCVAGAGIFVGSFFGKKKKHY
jgi:uncharacterized ion transporter superfamily protein YfcC